MDAAALRLSLELAAATTATLLLVGVPLAYWLAFTRSRARALVEALVALPIVLPPTVLGFYLLVALGPRSPLGRGFEALAGHPLVFSFEGLLVASVLYSLPFAVQPILASFRATPPRLVEAARTLGDGPWHVFRRVIAPLSRPGLFAGAVLAFAHTLGEFGVVLMVGGNVPGRTRTLAIAIYDDVQALDYDSAHTTSLVLLAVSFLVLALVYALQPGALSPWKRS